jgi:hypothetical protein
MKFSLLALCCLVRGTTAFVVPTPTNAQVTALKSTAEGDGALWMANEVPEAPEAPVAIDVPEQPAGPLDTVQDGAALNEIWKSSPSVRIEGESLRTWTVDQQVNMMHVSLSTTGRPLTAKIDLWHGPDYTPSHLKIYLEDGLVRPFNAIVATPLSGNTIAIYNEASMEYPFDCVVEGDVGKASLNLAPAALYESCEAKNVQGGMVTSYAFDSTVESVEILLKTDGRNLKARIELLTGPNNIKQVMEYYASDGKKRPFYAVIQTPGAGNVVRLVNENSVEYPFNAIVEPYVLA